MCRRYQSKLVRNNPEDIAETKKSLKELKQTMRQTPPREADNANVRKLENRNAVITVCKMCPFTITNKQMPTYNLN
jgi:hypothetical protein